jgi:small-conductance mechanosensitive channel
MQEILTNSMDKFDQNMDILRAYYIYKVPVGEILIALALFFITLIFLLLLKKIIIWQLNKLAFKIPPELDSLIIEKVEKLPILLFVCMSISLILSIFYRDLVNKTIFLRYLEAISFIITLILLTTVIQSVLVWLMNKFIAGKREKIEENVRTYKNFADLVVRICVWLTAAAFILNLFGLSFSTVLTSLGISTVVILFSLQTIIADIFSSFTIYFDKPFIVGDFIRLGEETGHVSRIGLKSTRIKLLKGGELIVPNKDLIQTKVCNYHKINLKNITYQLPLALDNTYEKVKTLQNYLIQYFQNRQDSELVSAGVNDYLKDGTCIDYEVVFRIDQTELTKRGKIKREIGVDLLKITNNRGLRLVGVSNSTTSK